MEHNISLSDGTNYAAELRVYRDWTTEGNGKWRLFWEDPNRPGCGIHEQSTVTGHPFFATMKGAVAYGERRYSLKATKADW